MNNRKTQNSEKRKYPKDKAIMTTIVMSFAFMFLCVIMLAGLTYAWFTTTLESTGNTLSSGGFTVTAEYKNDYNDENWTTLGTNPLFNDSSLAPGVKTAPRYIKVTNTGSVKVKVLAVIPKITPATKDLSDKLTAYVKTGVEGPIDVSTAEATETHSLETVDTADSVGILTNAIEIDAGGSAVFAVWFGMAGDEGIDYDNYNGANVTFNIQFIVSQSVVATDEPATEPTEP